MSAKEITFFDFVIKKPEDKKHKYFFLCTAWLTSDMTSTATIQEIKKLKVKN